jgi:hypothetical protein
MPSFWETNAGHGFASVLERSLKEIKDTISKQDAPLLPCAVMNFATFPENMRNVIRDSEGKDTGYRDWAQMFVFSCDNQYRANSYLALSVQDVISSVGVQVTTQFCSMDGKEVLAERTCRVPFLGPDRDISWEPSVGRPKIPLYTDSKKTIRGYNDEQEAYAKQCREAAVLYEKSLRTGFFENLLVGTAANWQMLDRSQKKKLGEVTFDGLSEMAKNASLWYQRYTKSQDFYREGNPLIQGLRFLKPQEVENERK